MTSTNTTLLALTADLDQAAPDQPLIFVTDEGDIGPGYHVTELKHLAVNSIDCGGQRSSWDEAQLQLLDGRDGTHMSVGKFVTIAQRSMAAVGGLGEVPLSVEYAPQNQGLHRYHIGKTTPASDGLRLSLLPDAALCKPASKFGLSRSFQAKNKAGQKARPASDCCAPR
jgi:hypothetical protein